MTPTQLPVAEIVKEIACDGDEPVRIMEVCGTHTVSLLRSGVKSLLPDGLHLVSGPGCPVCVTSQGYLDTVCDLADRDDVTVATYGDMVRVPGRRGSLADRRAAGARVLTVYSARDALEYAVAHPDEQVVFLAIGFETTAPATAAVLVEAARRDVRNLTVLPAHKRVVPAMEALLADGGPAIDGFLCPGHVSVVIGSDAYTPLVAGHAKPCVVAGFEPRGMLEGIARLVRRIRAGTAGVENVYPAVVTPQGNATARRLIDEVFHPADDVWRAIGTIPLSGLELNPAYAPFDARVRFEVEYGPDAAPPGCRCGEVIQGKLAPRDCPLFGVSCTPIKPVGPCMVSSEGTCAAWYKYRQAEPRRAGAEVPR
jgi:hydrogenase expression/formation protein HypD